MKRYEASILESRPEDTSDEQFLGREEFGSSAEDLLNHISSAGKDVVNIVKSKLEEPDEIYSVAYKKCYFCLGLSRIIKLKKLVHIFEILEFVLDFGRTKQDFTKHSMVYVVELIFENSEKILTDYIEKGSCDFDLSDIISECKLYLVDPLKAYNSEIEKKILNEGSDDLNEIVAALPETPVEFTDIPEPDQISDDPEELDFPVDKVPLVLDFCEEATDNLDDVEMTLIKLEDNENPIELVNQVFRAIHTVKGGARLLEIKKIESLAHQMESLLDDVRTQIRPIDAHLIDVLMDGNAALSKMVQEVGALGNIKTKINDLMQRIDEIRKGKIQDFTQAELAQAAEKSSRSDAQNQSETKDKIETKPDEKGGQPEENIRVPAGKLDEVLNTASEVFITRIRLQNDIQVLSNAINNLERITRAARLSGVAESVETVMEKCSELELDLISNNSDQKGPLNKSRRILKQITDIFKSDIFRNLEKFPTESRLTLLRIEDIRKQLQKNVDDLEGLSGRLQTGAMGFRMVPIAQLFNRFPGQVRKLSREIGKKAKLTISGADTELDKLLINKLADPLIHIMRNSIDHAFEPSDERIRLGKPEIGEIKISAFYQGSNAVIEVSDDGAGINTERVLAKALSNEVISKEDAAELSDKEILDLVFEPGFSMAQKVTELSGRGVGMDVVKTAISGVQGAVQLDSELGRGTTVTMKLPLTLAIVGILLVSENGHQFAFPVLNVVEVLSIKRTDLKKVGESLVFNYRGSTLNVNSLSKFLNFPSSAFDEEECSIIVLTDGDRHLGILVDEIKGRQDVLIKQFGSLLAKIDYMMGCTILSDSSLVLIVNIWELLTSNSNQQLQIDNSKVKKGVRAERGRHKVLVVDDSAMQRSRMSSILKQAGYDVETAVDGHDALQKTELNNFSAFCVDIMMPLMDGYEFIEKLRASEKNIDATVVLITGKKITEGAEQRRIESLNIAKLFEKPVPEQEFISALDNSCFALESQKGDKL